MITTYKLPGMFNRVGLIIVLLNALLVIISFIVFTGYPDGGKALLVSNSIFLIIGLLGYYLFHREAGILKISDEGITKVKFGKTKTINFNVITEVRYSDRQIIPGFVIKSATEKIVIPKTGGFNKIYHQLKVRLPEIIVENARPVKFSIDSSEYKIGIPLLIGIPAIIVFLVYMGGGNVSVAFWISFGIFLILFGLLMMETPPNRPVGFILYPDHLVLKYMFKKSRKVSASSIVSAELKEEVQTSVTTRHLPYVERFIEVKFNTRGQKPWIISNSMATMFRTSLEEILNEIQQRYLKDK